MNVRSTEVEQTFREQREEAFPNARAFRRYLRRSGQTSADVRLRVRTDLLTQRLRDLAVEGATTPAEERERLDAFVAAFRRKWRARTVCRAPWVSRSTAARFADAQGGVARSTAGQPASRSWIAVSAAPPPRTPNSRFA